ncbi:class III lanthionine synthetase LanKC [Phaeacidiphilus oryzae]|uniref:class III lanthionine synthetase LanKC n=1 Tax=Phaeacidiphilus oryzae TaxID=348818 RepID=UPI00056CCE9A|nr:class III lanthionine synthetase LanKC [Phaeacidiphilus oryzae]
MEKRYEAYCLADRTFYETPGAPGAGLGAGSGARTAGGDAGLLAAADRPTPDGWRRTALGDWVQLHPENAELPAQGWKIHVSATLDNADRVLERVWEICVSRRVSFKFVPTRRRLLLRNAKYAPRGQSGKFATVYPADERAAATLVAALGDALAGEPGPYILSDLRCGADRPVFVRYGGFTERYCTDEHGSLVPAIEDAGGRLVPDVRGPVFALPEWVPLPGFLRPYAAERAATTVGDLPYRIDRALHFSNGGGVYAGTDLRSGRQVVLKEARPHAGLGADGADAVARLRREHAALKALEGLDAAPDALDWFELGEHHFLVEEFLPGRTLNSCYAERYPLISREPSAERLAAYTRWALGVQAGVEAAVRQVHGRGIVFHDLHMFNVMVRPDDSVALLDFEAAAPLDEGRVRALAHPGFLAPADRTGFAVDRYALACLRLALFLPLTSLIGLDRGKARHLAELIRRMFPDLDERWLTEAVAEIEGEPGPASGLGSARARSWARRVPVREGLPAFGDWPAARDAMAAAILASATPEREDRLFPGDIAQFTEDGRGHGLAHGACGVLYALAEAGAPRYPAGEEWLLRAARRGTLADGTGPTGPHAAQRPGLYDGLAGDALVLARLGHPETAGALTEAILAENWLRLPSDLYGGLAGIGLLLDRLGTDLRRPDLSAAARQAADTVADRLAAGRPVPRVGLLHGRTGAALFLIRHHEAARTVGAAEEAYLDLAGAALRAELDRCVKGPDGALAVDEGTRTMPYLGAGSVGIGTVLDDYLRLRPGEAAEFAEAREAIGRAARCRFYAQPGLFRGRAGMILALAREARYAPEARQAMERQLAELDWYSLPYGGGLAVPGDQMLRLSMDLATGTAGCLLAVAAAVGPHPTGLPFLPALHPLPQTAAAPEHPSPTGAG